MIEHVKDLRKEELKLIADRLKVAVISWTNPLIR